MNLIGSIEVSAIPKELFKKVTKKDGTTGIYLNIGIFQRKEPSQFGATHFVSVAPKKEERVDGVKYIVGDLKPLQQQAPPTPQQVEAAPPAKMDDLPF